MKRPMLVLLLVSSVQFLYSQAGAPTAYASSRFFETGQIRGTLFTGGDYDRGITSVLLIENGSNAYLEQFPTTPMENAIKTIDAELTDLGHPALVCTVVESNRGPLAEDAYLLLFDVTGDSVSPISQGIALPNEDSQVDKAPPTSGGWSGIRISRKEGGTADLTRDSEMVLYLSYDAKSGNYRQEDYTSAFAQKTVDDPDPYPEVPNETIPVPYYQLNDDKINLRALPSTSSPVLQTLSRDTLFSIVDRSDAPQTIGGVTDRWYKILLRKSTQEGWIFGGFIRKK